MRYHDITKDDMLNGDGLRAVLWVSGCSHCCKDCQNPITWDPQLYWRGSRNQRVIDVPASLREGRVVLHCA